MNKLFRLYNQNRILILTTFIVIALIIIVIQILNSILSQKREKDSLNKGNNANIAGAISKNNTSVITGKKVENNNEKIDVIKEFVKYCNEGKIENAYNMLTEDCKQRIYPSMRDFKEGYYDKIFYINRMYTLENWFARNNLYTYYINYTEDVLASGNIDSSDKKGDYITVTKINGNNYLNVNSYIGCIKENRNKIVSGINVTACDLYLYMDYTILNLKVKNNTQNTICIDTKENPKTMYLYDTNKVEYQAFLNEIVDEKLILKTNVENNLEIKFNKLYNPESRELSGIMLKDIVINYEKYISKTEEKENVTIDIQL